MPFSPGKEDDFLFSDLFCFCFWVVFWTVVAVQWPVEDSSESSSFYLLLMKLHCIFSISYKIQPHYVYFIIFWLRRYRPSELFLCLLWFFPYSRLSFILLFLCHISFLLVPCACVWENTRAWVPHFLYIYSHTEWPLFYFDSATTSAQREFGARW